MDDVELPHELTLAVIYVDEDMIELEATVGAGHWRGRSQAYTVSEDVAAFATASRRFADGAASEAEFTAEADTGIGLINLRFYNVDRAGHIACHIHLVTGRLPTNHRLSIEVGGEAWAVLKFAQQLGEMARTQAGQASLQVSPPNQGCIWP